MQMIVSRQTCASGVGDSTVVDLEAHLPYDMRTETAIAPSPTRGEGGTLNCAPSADTVAGNGAPLSWRSSAVADAGNRVGNLLIGSGTFKGALPAPRRAA